MRNFQEFSQLSWRGCNMSAQLQYVAVSSAASVSHHAICGMSAQLQYVACQLGSNMSQWHVSSAATCQLSSVAICQLSYNVSAQVQSVSSAAICQLRSQLSCEVKARPSAQQQHLTWAVNCNLLVDWCTSRMMVFQMHLYVKQEKSNAKSTSLLCLTCNSRTVGCDRSKSKTWPQPYRWR